jgi:hypothetical protein
MAEEKSKCRECLLKYDFFHLRIIDLADDVAVGKLAVEIGSARGEKTLKEISDWTEKLHNEGCIDEDLYRDLKNQIEEGRKAVEARDIGKLELCQKSLSSYTSPIISRIRWVCERELEEAKRKALKP